jgi:hypothetical protein
MSEETRRLPLHRHDDETMVHDGDGIWTCRLCGHQEGTSYFSHPGDDAPMGWGNY